MAANLILQSALLSILAMQSAEGGLVDPSTTLQPATNTSSSLATNGPVSNTWTTTGSSWEFGVPSPAQVLDQESDGAPDIGTLLSEKLAPDPRSVFLSEDQGNKMGLIGQADEMCLGGLIARINRRAVNYGICGALFGATAGCLLAILPVYFCNDQIQTVGDQTNVTPPDITILAIPAALIGTPPGCVLGGGTGATAGVISAFLFPHEPSPKSSEGSDGSEGELGENDGENENEHSVIRKKRKPKPRKKPRGTSRENKGSDARGGDHGTEHRTDADKADRVRKEDRDAKKPSVRDSKQPSGDRLKRDEKVEDENKPEVPKDSESVKKKKKRKAKKPDKKPSKARNSEGALDPNNKSGDPFSSDQ
jgi:hypothetical protein